jgi:hypothetical protein
MAPLIMKAMAWSTSKVDAALECPFKFKKIYIDKEEHTGKALILGNLMHKIMADEILAMNTNVEKLVKRVDDLHVTDPEVYKMIPNVTSFVQKWEDLSTRENITATIEKQYAINRDYNEVSYFAPDVFIRGVFDMWSYDENNRRLIVLDHKTNKSTISSAKVKTHNQLNLYVWMLTKMFGLKWDKAHIALHFLRHGKITWAIVTQEEMEAFGIKYVKLLNTLEEQIAEYMETDNWPRTRGFYCRYCSFRNQCGAHEPEMVEGAEEHKVEGLDA